MKSKWTLLLIGGLSALGPVLATAQTVDLSPMVVQGVTGNLHIFQSTPIGCPDVNGDIPVTGEWFRIAPAEGLDVGGGNRGFLLQRGTVRIHPFTVHVSCLGHDETQAYSTLSVEVAQAVFFEGPAVRQMAGCSSAGISPEVRVTDAPAGRSPTV